MVVSGFASYYSIYLSTLQADIEAYNRGCTNLSNQQPGLLEIDEYKHKQSHCANLAARIRKQQYQLNRCREMRNDDIANKFNRLYR